GRRECHRVDLGTDDHRRQRWKRRWPGQLRRQSHADQLHRQRRLRRGRRRRRGEQWDRHTDRLHWQRPPGPGPRPRPALHYRAPALSATDGSLTVPTGCTIPGTSAGSGGGVDNLGTATLTNCSVSGNSAFLGGGLINYGTATLTNCTISGNFAESGVGLWNAG